MCAMLCGMSKTEELKKYVEDNNVVGLNLFFTDEFKNRTANMTLEEKIEVVSEEVLKMLQSPIVEDKELF